MPHINPDQTPMPLFVLSERYARISVPFHKHRRAQLIHVSSGTLTVATQDERWTIPPQRAVWIAPGIQHRIASSAPFLLTTCYLEPRMIQPLQQGLVAVDLLTRALLMEVSSLGESWKDDASKRLVYVLMDRLAALPKPAPGLPLAQSGPLAHLMQMVLDAPGDHSPLSTLAHRTGLSERTAARHFKATFAMTFGMWRRQVRLQTALAQLGTGVSVTEVAFDVGYRDVSSFITAFRNLYGVSPGKVFGGGLKED